MFMLLLSHAYNMLDKLPTIIVLSKGLTVVHFKLLARDIS